MVMGRVESCGILSLPEWPDPTETTRRVCVHLGTPQWLGAFSASIAAFVNAHTR